MELHQVVPYLRQENPHNSTEQEQFHMELVISLVVSSCPVVNKCIPPDHKLLLESIQDIDLLVLESVMVLDKSSNQEKVVKELLLNNRE